MTARMLPLIAALALAAGPAQTSDAVFGQTSTFSSPNGISERCVRIAPVPDGIYTAQDAQEEEAYCAIDLYADTVALCPKTWSTSPGMVVYDISAGAYANNRNDFERNACSEGKSAKDLAVDDVAKFKSTMNAKGTSGTFSTSSLLYYHFSRYFETTVIVPVAVWRSMDASAHQSEVADRGLAISGNSHSGRMNHEGWRTFAAADKSPQTYRPTDELFTSDRKQVYGVLLSSPGHRYGSEINGTRRSGWGKGQNEDFQKTPAFLALRSDKPLEQAIAEGLSEGRKDRQIAKDLGSAGTPQQMSFWMKEVSEIVLLDFIFSQQDRVGNIDFTPYYYWTEAGTIKTKKAKHHEAGDGSVPAHAQLLRRSNLNDNDAGGRVAYANFAKTTQMLEKLRHFGPGTYTKLMTLNADLQAQGPMFQWVSNSFGLDDRQIAQIVKNTALATGILRKSCDAGDLMFDLAPMDYFLNGETPNPEVRCDGT